MLKNFFLMPEFLRFIVSAGTVAPVVLFVYLFLITSMNQYQINGAAIVFLSLCVTFIFDLVISFFEKEQAFQNSVDVELGATNPQFAISGC